MARAKKKYSKGIKRRLFHWYNRMKYLEFVFAVIHIKNQLTLMYVLRSASSSISSTSSKSISMSSCNEKGKIYWKSCLFGTDKSLQTFVEFLPLWKLTSKETSCKNYPDFFLFPPLKKDYINNSIKI